MSVTVDLNDRQFGNALFRYVYARLFAEINNLRLLTEFNHKEFVSISPQVNGRVFDYPKIICDDRTNWLERKAECCNYHFYDGTWSKALCYVPYVNRIKEFVIPAKNHNINYDDIVIHLRLGDFPIESQIHPSWYLDILSNMVGEKFQKLYIVTDLTNVDPSPIPNGFLSFKDYIDAFSKYSPIVRGYNNVDDWNFIRSFDRILISNGTFSWWAGFFSQAREIYAFERFPLSQFPGLIVVDGLFNGEV